MKLAKLPCVVFPFTFICLAAHAQTIPVSPSGLNGNWHIAGTRLFNQGPLLTLSIGVIGDKAYASGYVFGNCSDGKGGTGGTLGVGGQIRQDGTFELTSSAPPAGSVADPRQVIQVTIDGALPANGETTWNGSFRIVRESPRCDFDISQDFVATRYPPLNGTYAGSVTNLGKEPGISITLQVSQAAASPSGFAFNWMRNSNTSLIASIAVTGSRCFTSGTTTPGPDAVRPLSPSRVAGDQFFLYFQMNDGSLLNLAGSYLDPSESALSIERFTVTGGACSGALHGGTLTKQ